MSSRDLGKAPAPPPPRRQPRRSTTHGVGWYAAEDGEDVAQPVGGRKTRALMVAILVTLCVIVLGLAGAFVWMRMHRAGPAAAAPMADAAPIPSAITAADAAPAVKMAKIGLSSSPPGADFVVDGKPVGKAPAEIEAAEKSKVLVEATLPGHQPWKQEVEVAARGNKVVAKLVPVVVDAGPAADAKTDAGPAAEPAKKATKTPAKKSKKKSTTRKRRHHR